jgi:hypothetical protein
MEVQSVDGQDLRTENGMVRQIMDAFERKDTARTVILELYSRRSNSAPVKVAFAR